MKHDTKRKCDKCKKICRVRKLKRLNGGYFCIKCRQNKRKEHREFLLRDICGVRKKEDIMKEAKEKREKITISKVTRPIIRGVKKVFRTKQIHLYLTKEERQFLYKKHIREGDTPDEASEKVDNCSDKLNKLIKKLKEKRISKEEINRRFKEEFARLCEQ